jgi:hypothetical protein
MGLINHRTRFLASPHRSRFHEEITHDWLLEGINAALLEMIDELPVATDQMSAMANSFRIDGARKLVRHLTTLTETAQPKALDKKANLDHSK